MADDKNNQRVIQLEDKELFELITEKANIVESGRAISREMQALLDQHEKLGQDMAVLAGKAGTAARRIFKRVKKLAACHLGEWEIPLTTEIRDGKVVLIIEDSLEQFKAEFKAQDKFKEPQAPERRK